MRLVRVENLSVLPPETAPWTDKCRHEDARDFGRSSCLWNDTDNEDRRKARRKDVDPIEMRKRNHIPDRLKHDRSNNRGSSCEIEAFPDRLTSRRDLFDARELARSGAATESYSRSKDVDRGSLPRHTSSSRCYAPKDHHKLGSPRVTSRRRTGENKERSPIKMYDNPIVEMLPDRKMERAAGGTALCDSLGEKQHSRECCSEKYGCGRCSNKAANLSGVDEHKVHEEKALRDSHNHQSHVNNREARGEASYGSKEGLASPSIAAKVEDAKCQLPGPFLRSEEANMSEEDRKRRNEMLASLLLDDPLDIDQDFDLALSPLRDDSQICGSIFGDAINFGDDIDFGGCEPILGTEKMSDGGCEPILGTEKIPDGIGKSESQPSRLFVDVTNKFKIHTTPVVKEQIKENNSHRLAQRQKQIDFGKNTLGYERYIEVVPRWKRTKKDPQTPNPKQVCSKRSWDGQICKWRRQLHDYDPPLKEGEELPEDFTVTQSDNGKHQNTNPIPSPTAKIWHSKTNLHKPAGLGKDHMDVDGGANAKVPEAENHLHQKQQMQPVQKMCGKLALRTGSCFDVRNQTLKNASLPSKGKGNSNADCGVTKDVICRRKGEAEGCNHPFTGMSAESSRLSIYKDWKDF